DLLHGLVGPLGALEGGVGVGHIRRMVLVVVNAHRLLIDVRLKRVVVVGEVGDLVWHAGSFRQSRMTCTSVGMRSLSGCRGRVRPRHARRTRSTRSTASRTGSRAADAEPARGSGCAGSAAAGARAAARNLTLAAAWPTAIVRPHERRAVGRPPAPLHRYRRRGDERARAGGARTGRAGDRLRSR